MKKIIRNNWKWILGFVLIFLCSLVLPFSGDDLDWGMKSISEYGSLLLDPTLNGRYVGNFLVILITKHAVIRSLVTALIVMGIIYMIVKETKTPLIFVCLLFILMPVSIFRQSITWASGFTNYTISTLGLLIILVGIRQIFLDKYDEKYNVAIPILIFLTSFFLENVTLFLALLTIAVNVFYYIKHKKWNKLLVICSIVSIIGTILMFIQPAYRSVASGDDGYRTVANSLKGTITRCVINYVYFIHRFVAFENVILLTVITLSLRLYFKKNEKDYPKLKTTILNVSFCIMVAFLTYVALLSINPSWQLGDKIQTYFNAFLSLAFIIITLVQVFFLFYSKKSFWKVAMPLICITGLIAPLFLVDPLGPRNFFVIYVLEMIEVFYILNEAKFDYEDFKYGAATVLAVMIVYYFSVYARISIVYLQRDNYIEYMSSQTVDQLVVVPETPFKEFVHYDNFSDKHMNYVYNKNKNVREDIKYSFIPYVDWVNMMWKSGYKIVP